MMKIQTGLVSLLEFLTWIGITQAAVVHNGSFIPPITSAQSPETYIGYSRSELPLHHWTISGDWIITNEAGETQNPGAVLRYNFSA